MEKEKEIAVSNCCGSAAISNTRMTKKELEAELLKAKKEIKRLNDRKLIDLLAGGFKTAGIMAKRDGWEDGKPSDSKMDCCEGLDIYLYSPKKSRRYNVHFYFTKDATKLTDVNLFVEKRVYDEANMKRLA